ncbi:MAG: sigma-70 family RNA polymerase sigma factor [Gemmatales bacterium]|nr:sigma-70 family RNA polymerase sigma factor [Gemmatales bacterium]MDW8387295.1 sigma-70 family RNA polymerase sigma factor [Gemmatales bacterium]
MEPARSEFQVLMDQVLAGSEDAARQLVRTYGPAVLRAVRRKLNGRLRSKFDSDDFVQDVWASFFASPPRNHDFASPQDLAAYLIRVARNKVIDVVRQRLHRQRYDVKREQSLQARDGALEHRLVSPHASPSTIAMTAEEWEALLRRQPPVYRAILLRYREGQTPTQIAASQGISERTVRRVLARTLSGYAS